MAMHQTYVFLWWLGSFSRDVTWRICMYCMCVCARVKLLWKNSISSGLSHWWLMTALWLSWNRMFVYCSLLQWLLRPPEHVAVTVLLTERIRCGGVCTRCFTPWMYLRWLKALPTHLLCLGIIKDNNEGSGLVCLFICYHESQITSLQTTTR